MFFLCELINQKPPLHCFLFAILFGRKVRPQDLKVTCYCQSRGIPRGSCLVFALYVLIFMLIVFLFSEEVMRNETLLLATNFAMPGPHINAPRRFFFFDAG